MRVLITGVSGFVGRHLASHARHAGADVVGLGRNPVDRALRDQLDDFLVADLGDPAAAARAVRQSRPDRIFHLSAQASVGASWTAPGETITPNLTTSLHLLEAVRAQAPDTRVVVAGSGEEYGPVPDARLPITEAELLRPQNPYAVSKAAVDLLAGFYADAYDLDVVRTRAFNHCGPGQTAAYVVGAFASQIAEAEAAGHTTVTMRTGDLRPRRDFTDVRDVVRAYWLASELAPAGIYNVCSGRPTPIADILAMLAAQSSAQLDQQIDPQRLRKHEVMEIRGSHDRLTAATGWNPEIPLERTLRDTLAWWREQIAAGAVR
jgi:GDP-4-dehydro-6-deoxy-D-mannose reductase